MSLRSFANCLIKVEWSISIWSRFCSTLTDFSTSPFLMSFEGWKKQTMESAGSCSISWQLWEPKASTLAVARVKGCRTVKGGWHSWLCFCAYEWIYWWKPNLWWCLGHGKGCFEDVDKGSCEPRRAMLNQIRTWHSGSKMVRYQLQELIYWYVSLPYPNFLSIV